jgi:hypothetical protein
MSNGIAHWSTNYLSTESCVLSTESVACVAIPTYDRARPAVPALTDVASSEAVQAKP